MVPRYAIAKTARILYGENYTSLPMRHTIATSELGRKAEYEWRVGSKWCKLSAQTDGDPIRTQEGSLEQFITEHYWGYSAQRSGGGCLEYHVEHEPWRVWTTSSARFEGDADSLYGRELGAVIQQQPESAFVADGSPVIVYKGNRIQ